MKLYFIRHGQPIYDPDSLTPLGEEQAKALSKWFLHRPPEKIYSSSSNRAIQTSMPTCRLLGKEPILCDWAHEAKAFESFHAIDANGNKQWILEVPTVIKQFLSPEVRALGDERYTHPYFADTDYANGVKTIQAATDKFLEELGLRHDRENHCYHIIGDTPKRVALFAHYGAGLSILSSIMDIPYNVFCPHFNFALTGVTEINFHHHGDGVVVPQITCHSGTAHLYREGLE
jgi:probable phosphoglycerate mutase